MAGFLGEGVVGVEGGGEGGGGGGEEGGGGAAGAAGPVEGALGDEDSKTSWSEVKKRGEAKRSEVLWEGEFRSVRNSLRLPFS